MAPFPRATFFHSFFFSLFKCEADFFLAFENFALQKNPASSAALVEAHNSYVQQLAAANSMLDKYYKDVLPQLLQVLDQSTQKSKCWPSPPLHLLFLGARWGLQWRVRCSDREPWCFYRCHLAKGTLEGAETVKWGKICFLSIVAPSLLYLTKKKWFFLFWTRAIDHPVLTRVINQKWNKTGLFQMFSPWTAMASS